jgi:ATP-dependent Clp protease, protease subunit
MSKSLSTRLSPIEVTKPEQFIWVEKFNFGAVSDFHAKFRSLSEDPNVKVIPIAITSYGGDVYALLAMLDIMKMAKKPVATIAMGCAMSCGSVLLSAGTPGYRYIGSRSDVMIHEVSSVEMGKLTEITAGVKEAKRLNTTLMQELDTNAGQKPGFFKDQMKKRTNLDWYVNANEAKRLGLVDHIGIPEFMEE